LLALTPDVIAQRIVDLLPQSLASQVASEIGRRLVV
jgi:hypothetical protein